MRIEFVIAAPQQLMFRKQAKTTADNCMVQYLAGVHLQLQ
jgi:hypothetical protein